MVCDKSSSVTILLAKLIRWQLKATSAFLEPRNKPISLALGKAMGQPIDKSSPQPLQILNVTFRSVPDFLREMMGSRAILPCYGMPVKKFHVSLDIGYGTGVYAGHCGKVSVNDNTTFMPGSRPARDNF